MIISYSAERRQMMGLLRVSYEFSYRSHRSPLTKSAVFQIQSTRYDSRYPRYLSVSKRAVIGQFSGPYSPVWPAKI